MVGGCRVIFSAFDRVFLASVLALSRFSSIVLVMSALALSRLSSTCIMVHYLPAQYNSLSAGYKNGTLVLLHCPNRELLHLPLSKRGFTKNLPLPSAQRSTTIGNACISRFLSSSPYTFISLFDEGITYDVYDVI